MVGYGVQWARHGHSHPHADSDRRRVAAALALIHAAAAQDAAFEVASIRPNTSPASSELRAMPNGRLIATNVTLQQVLTRGVSTDHCERREAWQ